MAHAREVDVARMVCEDWFPTDLAVVVLTVQEFENLVAQNTRVGMKMLKVFSNQLRRIHSKVRTLLALDEAENPEDGLYHNAEFYLKINCGVTPRSEPP